MLSGFSPTPAGRGGSAGKAEVAPGMGVTREFNALSSARTMEQAVQTAARQSGNRFVPIRF